MNSAADFMRSKNAIIQASLHGVKIEGATIYVTGWPLWFVLK